MSTDFLKELGKKMKHWRKEKNISQEMAGLAVGIDQRTWSKYERGVMLGGNALVVEAIRQLIKNSMLF